MSNLVSVILTSYNRPRLVKEAISSVLAQSYEEFQLIIVDDGSNDQTVDAILSFEDSRINSWFMPRLEVSGCRYTVAINKALELVKGTLITYLTDDDLYRPQRLERMVEKFELTPEAYVVYGNQKIMDIGEGWSGVRGYRGTFGITRNPQCRIDHNSFMHRQECLLQLTKPYWPEDDWRNGDVGFFNRLVEHWDFYPVEEVLDVHRWHANNVQSRMIRGEEPIYQEEY